MKISRRVFSVGFCGWLWALDFGAASGASKLAAWQIETVDQSGTGRPTAMRIDKDGNAHLVFAVEDADNSLKYAFWDHSLKRWFTMLVAIYVLVGSMTMFAVGKEK